MVFKQAILTALRGGMDADALLAFVHACQPDARKAYAALEEIWLELGFDSTEAAPFQDDMEFVMEKLWYSCRAENSVS